MLPEFRLTKFIRESNLQLADVSKECGMSVAYISNVMRGKAPIGPALAVKLDKAYGPQYTCDDAFKDYLEFCKRKFETKLEIEKERLKQEQEMEA